MDNFKIHQNIINIAIELQQQKGTLNHTLAGKNVVLSLFLIIFPFFQP